MLPTEPQPTECFVILHDHGMNLAVVVAQGAVNSSYHSGETIVANFIQACIPVESNFGGADLWNEV
jgi:hypothetical protein